MEIEISSKEYWELPEFLKEKYQQTSLIFDGDQWVKREFYGDGPVKIKTVYRLKTEQPGTFGGMGMGTF